MTINNLNLMKECARNKLMNERTKRLTLALPNQNSCTSRNCFNFF